MTESSTPPPSSTPPTPLGSQGPTPDKDSITMGMLCHLLGIFTGFLGPLIILLLKKDNSPFVDDQGKEALNFQITTLVVCLICIPLNLLFCIGSILILIVQICRIVFGVMGTLQANKGIAYRYPRIYQLIK